MFGISGFNEESIQKLEGIVMNSGSVGAFRKEIGFEFQVDNQALDDRLVKVAERRNKLNKLLHSVN